MQFITNKISTNSNSKTFAQIVDEMRNKKSVKTASANGNAKTAEAEEAPSSGQPETEAKLVNEPEKETSTSTSKKKNDEGPSSGQPEAEAKLVNVPEKKKEASNKGMDYRDEKGEVPGEQDTGPHEYEEKDEKDKKDDKDEKGLTEEQKEKLPDGLKNAIKNKKETTAGKEERKKEDGTGPYKDSYQNKKYPKGKKQMDGKECPNKESSENLKWIKIANLNDKTKTWLRKYYSNVWPAEFIDALLADK